MVESIQKQDTRMKQTILVVPGTEQQFQSNTKKQNWSLIILLEELSGVALSPITKGQKVLSYL